MTADPKRGQAAVKILRSMGGDVILYRNPYEIVFDLPDDPKAQARWTRLEKVYSYEDIEAHMELETPTIEWIEEVIENRSKGSTWNTSKCSGPDEFFRLAKEQVDAWHQRKFPNSYVWK